MAEIEYVDGAGWISDESDFYGDRMERRRCEEELRRRPKRPYQSPVKLSKNNKARLPPTPPSTGNRKDTAPPDEAVIDFLKSRPQLSGLARAQTENAQPRIREKPRTVDGEEVEDLVDFGTASDRLDTWQSGKESIDEFLSRMPVDEVHAGAPGPWLWVHCPRIPRSHQPKRGAEIGRWSEEYAKVLQDFNVQRAKIETLSSGQEPATIARKMRPHRDQLEDDLLSLAVKEGCTTGKWMLFPKRRDLLRYWRLVATATAEGKLGMTAKVSTEYDEDTLICVYTYNFFDTKDVVRVLKALVELGLCSSTSKSIYYKCDAYTHLGIKSGNPYGLRASLFSSKDILHNEHKVLKEGPVARMRKRIKKDDEVHDLFAGDDIE